MIVFDKFFTQTMNTVDGVITNFVHNAYVHFIQANTNVITLSFTLYIMLLGYQFISHHHHFQIGDVVKKLILMLCVFGLVMNWQLYHLFVFNIFTNEPAHISQVLISSAGDGYVTGNIADALDGICEAVVNAARGMFGEINFSASGLAFILYGVMVLFIGGIMIIYAMLLFIYAKMMMAVLLALGPVFLLFIMWDQTKGLFASWLNSLIAIALIPVITSAILMLMLSVVSVTLPHLNQPVEDMQFVGIIPFLGLCLATAMILAQVLRISSSLGGGIVLSGLSTGAHIASNVWNKSGLPNFINHAKNFGRRQSISTFRHRGKK